MCKVVFLSPFDIASQIVSCLKIKGLLLVNLMVCSSENFFYDVMILVFQSPLFLVRMKINMMAVHRT